MTLLIAFAVLSIGFSFLCSILEAALLSVTPSYIASLKKERPQLFARLRKLKDDVDDPLSAILTLNTVAHTVGATGVGAKYWRSIAPRLPAILGFMIKALLPFIWLSKRVTRRIGSGEALGYLHRADLINLDADVDLLEHMRKIKRVKGNTNIEFLFSDMLRERQHLAVVYDQLGPGWE
jgi:CBS domain containing-hemolysin-like protein